MLFELMRKDAVKIIKMPVSSVDQQIVLYREFYLFT